MRQVLGLLLFCALPVLPGSNAYIQTNLVADTAGIANLTDPNLINPWGIAESATSPFWISDNGTGLATIYSTSATATLTISSTKPTIPHGAASPAGPAPVSGQLSNSTTRLSGRGQPKPAFYSARKMGPSRDGTEEPPRRLKSIIPPKARCIKVWHWAGPPRLRSFMWRISTPERLRFTTETSRRSLWPRALSPTPRFLPASRHSISWTSTANYISRMRSRTARAWTTSPVRAMDTWISST